MLLRRPNRRRRTRVLFVTGGSGFLGSQVVTGNLSENWSVVAPTSRSVDLTDRQSTLRAIADWKPTAIIHTAYRRGDRRATVDASRNIAEAATAGGARLVHVSSDAVFGGRPEPYVEGDPPAPVHEYGRDKADAETEVSTQCPEAVIVRTSLLFGRADPSPHELAVRDAIVNRTAMRFFTDEIRSAALVDDVAAALTELTDRPEIRGVLHLGGPDALSRADLARMTAVRYGYQLDRIRTGTLAESGLDRPGRVVLDSSLARSYGIAVRGPASWQ